MGKIFCIMGKSGTGKDTIYKEILKKHPNIKPITRYTTRPMRDGEIDGVEYNFIDNDKMVKMRDRIIEISTYDTVNGFYKYATLDDGNIDLEHNNYITIGTLDTYISLKVYFGEENTIPIYIEVFNVFDRVKRLIKRERIEPEPNYKEIFRRIYTDRRDYSDYKLKICGILEREKYLNKYLDVCINEILSSINAIIMIEINKKK